MDFRFQSLLRDYAAYGDGETAIKIANEAVRMNKTVSIPRLKYSYDITIKELANFINEVLENNGMLDLLDGAFSPYSYPSNILLQTLHPNCSLIVFASPGRSEGHYIHVDAHYFNEEGGRTFQPVLMGKTFAGMHDAAQIAAFISEVLENYG